MIADHIADVHLYIDLVFLNVDDPMLNVAGVFVAERDKYLAVLAKLVCRVNAYSFNAVDCGIEEGYRGNEVLN